MAQPSVAFCPSNQSRNVCTIRGYETYNEAGGMAFVAPLIVEACRQRGINAEWFPARLETEPGQTYPHQWIYEQIARANAWLAAQPGTGESKAMLHFHTDSGAQSHTFGIFVARQLPPSQRLADCVGRAVQRVLGTENLSIFDRLGSVDYNAYVFAQQAKFTTALLECLSHQNERDMAALYADPRRLAVGVANGLVEYWALQPRLTVEALLAELEKHKATEAQALALLEQAMVLLKGAV